MLLLLGLSAAAEGILTDVDYRDEAFVFHLSDHPGTVTLESWDSLSDGVPTRMAVLDFAGIENHTEDRVALSAVLDKLRRRHSEIRRLLLLAPDDGGMRVVLEITHPEGGKWRPRLSGENSRSVQLALHPEWDEPEIDPARLSAMEAELETLRTENKRLAGELATARKLLQEMEQAADNRDAERDGEKILALAAELQQAMDERHALEQRVIQLEKLSGEQRREIERLLQKTVDEAEVLRGINVNLSDKNISDVRMNRNLRAALLHVSNKLTEAENRLAEAEVKLARLSGKPVLSSSDSQKEAAEKAAISGKPVVPGKVIYNPPVRITESRDETGQLEVMVAAPPVREVTLGASNQPADVLRAIIENNPKQADTYFKLKNLYVQSGNYRAAEGVLNALIREMPGYAPAYYELAEIYRKQEQPVKAQALMETYRKLLNERGNRQ